MTTGPLDTTAVRAPGKMMWLGEFAVLDGAPAVVAAVDRYVRATWRPFPGGPDFHEISVRSSLTDERLVLRAADGALPDAPTHPALALLHAVAGVLRESPEGLRPDAGALEVDSHDLSGDAKLGLGSSGAVAAAATALLAGAPLDDARLLALALAAHHRFQGGVGSGSDVIASCHGGVLAVQRGEQPRRIAVPPGLYPVVVHTGAAADTRSIVRAVREALARGRGVDPWRALADVARRGVAALEQGDVAGWISAVRDFHHHERELSEQTGVPIVTPTIDAVARLAEPLGGAAKASGAGGGDVVIAFLPDAGRRDAFLAMAVQAGLEVLTLAVAPHGVLLPAPSARGR